jgi:hypothetical protein
MIVITSLGVTSKSFRRSEKGRKDQTFTHGPDNSFQIGKREKEQAVPRDAATRMLALSAFRPLY